MTFEITKITQPSAEWRTHSFCYMCRLDITEGTEYAHCEFYESAFDLCFTCIPEFIKEVRIKLDPNIRAFT